jgi:hypothetical protein
LFEQRRASPTSGSPTVAFFIGVKIGPTHSFAEALSYGTSVTLSVVVVEALWKEREDALGVIEDARRDVEEEQLATTMAENVRNVA